MLRSSSRVHYVYTDNTAAMNRSHIHPVHDLRRRYQPDTEGRDPRDSVRDSTRVEDKWPNGVLPRDPSHSPRSNRQELQEYPLRAPYDPYREQSYQIRLPPEPRYSDARPPGHVSYSYPRSADDHGLERNYVDRGPERHVEYIPVSDGHFNHPAGRYVVTHPTENRVRVDRGYPSEQIYERDGQYFYTEPRQFETHTARGAGAEYIQYRLA